MQYLEVVKQSVPSLNRILPSRQNSKIYIYAGGAIVAYIALKSLSANFQPWSTSKTLVHIHNGVTIKKDVFKEALASIKSNSDDKTRKLEILEIGIGPGSNFKFFPSGSNLTILDKTDGFLQYLQESIKKENRQDLTLSKLVINPGENMRDIASNSMDVVVHTFIMCGVDDPVKVFQEIYRVLKPGGVSIFMEHIGHNPNILVRGLRKIMGLFHSHSHDHSHDQNHSHSHDRSHSHSHSHDQNHSHSHDQNHSHSHDQSHSHGHEKNLKGGMKELYEKFCKQEEIHLQEFYMKPLLLRSLNPILIGYSVKKPAAP